MNEVDKQLGIVKQMYTQGWQEAVSTIGESAMKYLQKLIDNTDTKSDFSDGYVMGVQHSITMMKLLISVYKESPVKSDELKSIQMEGAVA